MFYYYYYWLRVIVQALSALQGLLKKCFDKLYLPGLYEKSGPLLLKHENIIETFYYYYSVLRTLNNLNFGYLALKIRHSD